jgi:hypothetical protein
MNSYLAAVTPRGPAARYPWWALAENYDFEARANAVALRHS